MDHHDRVFQPRRGEADCDRAADLRGLNVAKLAASEKPAAIGLVIFMAGMVAAFQSEQMGRAFQSPRHFLVGGINGDAVCICHGHDNVRQIHAVGGERGGVYFSPQFPGRAAGLELRCRDDFAPLQAVNGERPRFVGGIPPQEMLLGFGQAAAAKRVAIKEQFGLFTVCETLHPNGNTVIPAQTGAAFL